VGANKDVEVEADSIADNHFGLVSFSVFVLDEKATCPVAGRWATTKRLNHWTDVGF
jgi:hypothetical protein